MNNNETNYFQNMNEQPQFSKKSKKRNSLIIIIIIMLLIFGGTFFISYKFLNGSSGNNGNSTINKEKDNNKSKKNVKPVQLIKFYNSLDTSKFDKNRFSGYLYKISGESVSVDSLLSNRDNFSVIYGTWQIHSNYTFLEDQSDSYTDVDNGKENSYLGDNLTKIINYLGPPTVACDQEFDGSGTDGGGWLRLYYVYDNYILYFTLYDYTVWEGYDYTSLFIRDIEFSKADLNTDPSYWERGGWKCK